MLYGMKSLRQGGRYLLWASFNTIDGSWDSQKKIGFYEDPGYTLPKGVIARDEVTQFLVAQVLMHPYMALLGLGDDGILAFAADFVLVMDNQFRALLEDDDLFEDLVEGLQADEGQ